MIRNGGAKKTWLLQQENASWGYAVAKSLQDSPGDASEASLEALAVQFGVGVAPRWETTETMETMVGL